MGTLLVPGGEGTPIGRGIGRLLSLAASMEATEASLTGTLRVIAILLLVWVLLRMLRRWRRGGGAGGKVRWVPPDQRPKGDVRIEQVKDKDERPTSKGGSVSDADFEELK
jgi:hypothetical protein